MGWVTMGGRELQRIEVLSEVLARRRTEISANTIQWTYQVSQISPSE